MRVILLILLIGLWKQATYAQPEIHRRARIYLDGQNIEALARLGIDCAHGCMRPHAYLESDFSETELRLARDNGFRCEVLIPDVQAFYAIQNDFQPRDAFQHQDCTPFEGGRTFPAPANFRLGSMGGFYTYTELLSELDSMASRYPHLISRRTVIDSNTLTHEGRPLFWVRISDNPQQTENEPEALYTALHHSREPLSATQLVYYMWYLLEHYDTDAEIRYLLDNTQLYFIPCVNPDGYEYNVANSPNGGGMWRKNRRPNPGGSFGVDLNRNYGYAFAFDNTGSSPNATSDTYRGPSAFSEPETRNVKKFCEDHDINLALNYHTYGNMLVYPWAHNSQATQDSAVFREYAIFMTEENRYVVGTNLETVGYNTNGDADDWFYGEQTTKGKILSMTPEAGSNAYGFYPPINQIAPLCEATVWQNLSLPRFLLNYATVTENSAPVITKQNPFIPYQIKRYGLAGGTFTVSFQPLTANILSVGNAHNHNLAPFSTQEDSIQIILDPNIQDGDSVRFVVETDNGYMITRDTADKVYGDYTPLLTDHADSLDNWTNVTADSQWENTTASYYSAPASITDSRTGNYANNIISELQLMETVDLRTAQHAVLSFWTKWDLEESYDYVQIMASDDNGTFYPLCGRYTNGGSASQVENEPLYDGLQAQWVQEEISLDPLLGNQFVAIKFRLVSDNWVNKDGFYFDEMQLNVLDQSLIPVRTIAARPMPLGDPQPNPASARLYLPYTLPENAQQTQLQVCDLLGRMIFEQQNLPANGLNLDVSRWQEGVYIYQIVVDGQRSTAQKVVITR